MVGHNVVYFVNNSIFPTKTFQKKKKCRLVLKSRYRYQSTNVTTDFKVPTSRERLQVKYTYVYFKSSQMIQHAVSLYLSIFVSNICLNITSYTGVIFVDRYLCVHSLILTMITRTYAAQLARFKHSGINR